MIFMTIATRSTSKMQITEAYPPVKKKVVPLALTVVRVPSQKHKIKTRHDFN